MRNDLKVRKSSGLLTLEPRVLLDAAGVITGAEGVVDALSQGDAMQAAELVFGPSPVTKNIGLNEAPILIGALQSLTGVDGRVLPLLDASIVFDDPDDDALTYTSVNIPEFIVLDPDTGILSGTPPSDASQGGLAGEYAITITATDPDGESISTNLAYNFSNLGPIITEAIFNLTAQDAESVVISSGFIDPDGDVLSYRSTELPTGLSIDSATGVITGALQGDASQGGERGDGVYAISISASDGEGGIATDLFALSVSNPAPDAVDDMLTTGEDTSLNVNILTSNDRDPDGDVLRVSLVNEDAANIGVPVEGDAGGVFTIDALGNLRFDPNGEFEFLAVNETAVTRVQYTIDDGEGGRDTARVNVTVTGVNDAPVPLDPSDPNRPPLDPNHYIPVQRVNDGAELPPFDLSAYFADIDISETPVLSLNETDLPLGLGFDGGVVSGKIDPSASIGGTGGNVNGVYNILVTATDPFGESFTTILSYQVSNLVPDANSDMFNVVEDTTAPLDLLGNDIDPDGDDLTLTQINGTPIIVGVATTLPSGATVTLNANGTVSYNPVTDYNGPDSFSYTIDDGQGGTDTQSVRLNVTPVNDAPVITPPIAGEPALAHQYNLDGETISPINVSMPFSDIEGDRLTFSATNLPEGLEIDSYTGMISGTLRAGASVNGPYNVTVTATDRAGASAQTEIIWRVENIAPVMASTLLPDVRVGEVFVLDVAALTMDGDGDRLVYSAIGLPAGLSLDSATGQITGRPIEGSEEPYIFTVSASDQQGGIAQAELSLKVAQEEVFVGGIYEPDRKFEQAQDTENMKLVSDHLALSDVFDGQDERFGAEDITRFLGGLAQGSTQDPSLAYVSVGTIVHEHAIYLSLTQTLLQRGEVDFVAFKVDMGEVGKGLPEWIDSLDGNQMLIINQNHAQDDVKLYVRAITDDRRALTMLVTVDMATGAAELSGGFMARGATLDEQLSMTEAKQNAAQNALLNALGT